jgi:hypothetical protein
LVSAFNDKSQRVKKKKDSFTCEIRNHVSHFAATANFSHSQKTSLLINSAIIDFPESCALFKVNDETMRHGFDVA